MINVDDEINLRLLSLASAATIYESINSSRSHLREWLPFVDATKNVIETSDFIKSVLNSRNLKQDRIYEIWYKNNFAGLISFKEIDKLNNKVEMGYWLDAKITGKGIMVRSVKRLVSYAFKEMKMNRLKLKVAIGNTKSKAISQKTGFKFEGIEREGEFLNGKYHDLEIYSLLKKEWS